MFILLLKFTVFTCMLIIFMVFILFIIYLFSFSKNMFVMFLSGLFVCNYISNTDK